jgi:LuxR family maltose regulon positive regulatory protein
MGDQQVFQPSKDGQGTANTAASPRPVIVTKIRVPRRRDDLLPRRRLVNFLHDHLDRKLLLISAPAGYGKTTLLTDFAHDTDLPVCWYTLDAFDRDLRVFLEHLIAAIALRYPDFGQRSSNLLQEMPDPAANLYPLVATLVQEIYETIPEYFFLVLDDHHTVEDQEPINEFLDLFVTYADENCHLVIASRTLPALPNLSLLVARRQAAGLSIDELRFTPQEIQALAWQNYQLALSPEQADELAERTGGWITGLLLTTAHRWEQAPGEMAAHGRINVDVYDYLSRQVLERQPPQLRDFLLASSVLDEMGPDLCAAVLQVDRPAELMDMVRMRNLFVTEFEGEQNRLRYHDLFRDFLQDALRQQDEARFRALTLRAAEAYAARGEWERAVSRYLALEQYTPVVEILQEKGAHLFDIGRWDTLAGWIDALPQEERAAHPRCLLYRGKIHMERGEHDQALALFDEVEERLRHKGDTAGRAYALVMKGYGLRFQGRYAEAIDQSRATLELVQGTTTEEQITMALAHKNTGLCRFRMGQLAQGQEALEQALRLYEAIAASDNEGLVDHDLGMVHHDLGLGYELMGNLAGAIQHYQAALVRWQQLGNPAPWANTLNGLGVVYYLQGRYEEAAEALEEALEKARVAGDLRVEAFVWASLGDLYRDQGAYERARQAYTQALEIADRSRAGFIQTYGANGLGNVSRLQGDRDLAARHLLKAMGLAQKHGSGYETGLCHISLGILAGDLEDLATARLHLDQAAECFESGGFRRDLAVARLHRAQVAFLAGEREDALADLQSVLELREELGFDQFMVVEGLKFTGLYGYVQEQGLGTHILPQLRERIGAQQARLVAHPEPAVRVRRQQALRILGLGQPRVELEGQSVQWTTTQSRDLFFCLLQYPQGLRKEEVGAIFWPEHPPHRLDGIFRSTLYRLRRAIFRESVVFEDGLYRFNWDTDYWYDVEAFDQLLDEAEEATEPRQQCALLEEALGLVRDEYLAGVYDDWCVLERERLRERRLDAQEALAGLLAGQGNLYRAIDEYRSLVAQDPYREKAHRELMRCHYRLGDRAAAVRQYQSCVQILRDDLGLSPAPETEALYLQIID